MIRQWIGLLAAVALSGAAFAQATQSSNYSTIEALPGKPVEVDYFASAKKDCSPAPLPTIRVIEAPKSGVLTVRQGALTTDRIAGCPRLKTPVQVVFYQARAGHGGADHIIYEVTSVNGEIATFDVSIKIKEPPSVPSKGNEL